MGKIILARHGQCHDNKRGVFNGRLNSSLTPEGVDQAFELGKALRGDGFDVTCIFTSPKVRTLETANVCSTFFKVVHIRPLHYLVERNHGILEGEPYSRVRELATTFLTHEGFDHILRAPEAETYEQLYDRAQLVYDRMLEEVVRLPLRHRDVLFIGHGVLFRMIWAIHHGRGVQDCIQDYWKNCEYRVLEKPR